MQRVSQLDEAVLTAIQALPTVECQGEVYLSSTAAMDAVVRVLYPGGVQDENRYHRVVAALEAACLALGYVERVTLHPPQVPFDRRGDYFRQLPPMTEGTVREVLGELEGRGAVALTTPKLALSRQQVVAGVARRAWQRHLRDLSTLQQACLQTRCDLITATLGWTVDEHLADPLWMEGRVEVRPMTPDLDALEVAIRRQR